MFITRRTTQLKATQSLTAATATLTANDSGKAFFLNLITGIAITLPAPTDGVEFTFIVGTAPTTANSGTGYVITNSAGTSGDNIVGMVLSAGGAPGDVESTLGGDAVNFVADSAVLGDRVHLISDGTNWYATAYTAVAGGVTITG